MQIVIDIPEEDWKFIKDSNGCRWSRAIIDGVIKGTPLPKGHGRLIDVGKYEKEYFNVAIQYDDGNHIHSVYTNTTPTIIEADKKYEAKVITRGNCMMCGKELTEGLFFCKECENKANRSREGEADGK